MSKIRDAVVGFVASGGHVTEDGKTVVGLRGQVLSQNLCGRTCRQYYAVSVYVPPKSSKPRKKGVRNPGTSVPIPVHQIVAYQKFGEDFLKAPCVRHLDDDPLNNAWDNIVLGTQKENSMDRSEEDRRLHAQKAGRTNSRPDEFWIQVEAEHAAGASYKELSERHGLSKSTLSYRLSKTGARTVMA